MEQCRQLYDDVMDAFDSEAGSYFLGNIVLAEDEHDDRPEVVVNLRPIRWRLMMT